MTGVDFEVLVRTPVPQLPLPPKKKKTRAVAGEGMMAKIRGLVVFYVHFIITGVQLGYKL